MEKPVKNKIHLLIFAFFLLLFVFFRIGILLTSLDIIYDSEELYRGAIAKEIINGRTLPLFDYLYTDYEGGSLLTGMAAVPFFRLFGESYFSLKLVTFSVSILLFALWYFLLYRYFGTTCAVFFAILSVFPVPGLLRISLTSWGNHFESLLFSSAVLILMITAYKKESFERRSFFTIFIAGMIAGAGIFFSYSIFPQLAAIILSIIIIDFNFSKKSFLPLSAGTAVGFAPGIYFNLTHSFAGFRIKGKSLTEMFAEGSQKTSALSRFKEFILEIIPSSACYSGNSIVEIPYSSLLITLIYILSIATVILFLIRNFKKKTYTAGTGQTKKKCKAIVILFSLLYLIFFAFAYSLTSFEIGKGYKDYFSFRYMAPALFILIIIMSVSLAIQMSGKKLWINIIAAVSILVAVVLNVNHEIKYLSFKSPTNSLLYKGYNYFWLGQVVTFRYGFDLQYSVAIADRIPQDVNEEYMEGLGFNYGWVFLAKDSNDAEQLESLALHLRNSFYMGLGESFSYFNGNNEDIDSLVNFASKNIPAESVQSFCKGFGRLMPFYLKGSYTSFFKNNYSGENAEAVCYGIGEGIAEKRGFNRKLISEDIAKSHPEIKRFIEKGAVSGTIKTFLTKKN